MRSSLKTQKCGGPDAGEPRPPRGGKANPFSVAVHNLGDEPDGLCTRLVR